MTDTKKLDDGGPAFPETGNVSDPRNDGFVHIPGMTLWDYYAAAALTGLVRLSKNGRICNHSYYPCLAAKQADAMIAERKRRF